MRLILQMDLCKPSYISEMANVSTRLEKVVVHRTLNSLEELLAFEEAPIPWPRLAELDASHNSIPEIHPSIVRDADLRL